ncbi:oxysterol-binding protein-related protein 4C-like isoform X1 [Nymphaea colorata]|nr:oxysterol-binding protein-related protein 4C-like isoform X1 [Nymphaea colorata]
MVQYRVEEEGNINNEMEGIPAEPILTAPMTLEGDSDNASSHKAPGIVPKVISLFKSVRPGSDLTKFQLPPTFNMPKSQLQSYGECVYSIGEDLLGRCAEGKSSLERFNAAVAWCISTTRPVAFGMAPFNPILGETHHVSMGSLNVLLEQVSHHPPVSALHATDEGRGIELIWCHTPVPRFTGAAVEGVIQGYRQIRLQNYGENYVMGCPKLVIRFLPIPLVEWVGNVTVRCTESGLEAILTYKGQSILGFGGNRVIKGKVFDSLTKTTLYELDGHWDKVVTKKEVATGKVSILYHARKALAGLRTPVLKDKKQGLLPSESSLVWAEVSKAILNNDWDSAREAKKRIEERERKLQRERASNGISWSPRYFSLVRTKENGWECSPKKSLVHAAPIVI